MDRGVVSNIRELLGGFIGKKILDITQHDPDEVDEGHYVMLMFDDGSFAKFYVNGILYDDTAKSDE